MSLEGGREGRGGEGGREGGRRGMTVLHILMAPQYLKGGELGEGRGGEGKGGVWMVGEGRGGK